MPVKEFHDSVKILMIERHVRIFLIVSFFSCEMDLQSVTEARNVTRAQVFLALRREASRWLGDNCQSGKKLPLFAIIKKRVLRISANYNMLFYSSHHILHHLCKYPSILIAHESYKLGVLPNARMQFY